MLDFAPNPLGLIADDQAARYADLGGWIRGCYGKPVAEVTPSTGLANGPNATLAFTAEGGASVDRIWVKEDQRTGQRIRAWVVEALAASNVSSSSSGSGGSEAGWTAVASGTSVGNKAIRLFEGAAPLKLAALRLRVTAAFADDLAAVRLASFAAFRCNRPSDSGCSITQDETVTFNPVETLRQLPGVNASACCAACAGLPACAVFVLSPAQLCSLLSADGVNSEAKGWITGSPNA